MEINNNNNYSSKKKKNNNYFLPEEISIDILSRLSTVSVIQCSLVCKAWRNLIVHNRDFPRKHLLRRLESNEYGASAYYNGRVNFLLLTNLGCKKGYQLYYTLDDDSYEKPEPRLRVLSSNPNPYNNKNYYVVGSCNGLICMAYANAYDIRDFEQPIYICNPITREWLALPSLTIDECCSSCSTNDNNDDDPKRVSRYRDVVCGFGYLPSTDEYKVVRITYCFHPQILLGPLGMKSFRKDTESRVGRVWVYTLGDGTGWRDKGKITDELEYFPNSPSILANGALHFLEESEGKIVAFDLADEEFLYLPPPPCFIPYDDKKYPFQIQVLGGQLCAFHCKKSLTVGMWFFKNKEEKNGNYKDENGRPEYQSWSWIKEFDIERDVKAGYSTPFILTEHGGVLYYSWKTLFCYDLKTATSKELVDMVNCLSEFYRLAAIPHLNSFISLKALGEEDTKIIIESAN